jgi:hypothetical protein
LQEALAHRKERARIMADENETAIHRALSVTLMAEKAGELDLPLEDLATLRTRAEPDREVQPKAKILERNLMVTRFVEEWQNLLIGLEEDDFSMARTAHSGVKNRTALPVAPFTRSEFMRRLDMIERRINDPNRVDSVEQIRLARRAALVRVYQTRELEDLPKLVLDLQDLVFRKGAPQWMEVNEVISELGSIWKAHESLLAGLGGANALVHVMRSPKFEGPEGFGYLRAKLVSKWLPKLIDPLAASGDERIEDGYRYLAVAWRKAVTEQQWDRAARITSILRTLNVAGVFDPDDERALRAITAARNLDRAVQYPLAVYYYQEALGTGVDFVPAEKFRARLETIRQEHPEDWERGLKFSVDLLGKTPGR